MNLNKEMTISLSICYITSLSFGFHLSSIEMIKKHFFKTDEFDLTNNQFYSVASILLITPILAGNFIFKYKWKSIDWIKNVCIAHACLTYCLMIPHFCILFLVRAALGIVIGISTAIVPRYLSMLNEQKRGTLVFLFQLNLLLGIFIGQCATYIASSFLIMKIIFTVFSLINVIAGAFFSDYLIEPQEDINSEKDKSVIELLKEKRAIKSLIIAFIIHFSQQMSGIRGLIVYSNTILKNTFDPQLVTAFIGLFSASITFCCSFVIDRVGRKPLLIFSSTVMTISHCLMIGKILPCFALCLYHFGYSLGIGPICWLITNEIFPSQYQKAANSLCLIVNWISAFLVVAFFEFLLFKISHRIFFVFIFASITLLISTILIIKETKGSEPNFQ